MKEPWTAAAAHKAYNDTMNTFRRTITDAVQRLRFGREIDPFMRACAQGLWQHAGEVTPQHAECYNAIYCKGNAVPSVLYWELVTAVSQFGGFCVPAFFDGLVESDQQTGKAISRSFIRTFSLMLLSFASLDSIVSEAEANYIDRCAQVLSDRCDFAQLPQDPDAVRAVDFITRNTDGTPVRSGDPLPAPATAQSAAEKTQTQQAAQTTAEPAPSLDELLAELDSLCGLKNVKQDVKSLINLVKVRRLREEAELPVPAMSLHLVFMGNPGTGKTTVARLLAKIYHAIGVLSKGQLIEVDRSGLVAGFVGQTAIKTNEAIAKAMGGVLFIDEAYSLVNQDSPNDFGQEAIEVLLKGMEDNRKDLIVIVAGYTELMGKFIASNPGLESRFNKYFYFEDYTGPELMEIFRSMCKKGGYTIDDATEKYAVSAFQTLYDDRDENFGNARDVRNIFEQAIARQSNRVAALEQPTKEDLMAITIADLQDAEEDVEGNAASDKDPATGDATAQDEQTETTNAANAENTSDVHAALPAQPDAAPADSVLANDQSQP